MKIGIYLEGSPKMGGGFFQSLKSSLLLLDIDKYKSKIELIITNNETKKYLLNKNLKNKLFKPNKLVSYFSQFFDIYDNNRLKIFFYDVLIFLLIFLIDSN